MNIHSSNTCHAKKLQTHYFHVMPPCLMSLPIKGLPHSPPPLHVRPHRPLQNLLYPKSLNTNQHHLLCRKEIDEHFRYEFFANLSTHRQFQVKDTLKLYTCSLQLKLILVSATCIRKFKLLLKIYSKTDFSICL